MSGHILAVGNTGSERRTPAANAIDTLTRRGLLRRVIGPWHTEPTKLTAER